MQAYTSAAAAFGGLLNTVNSPLHAQPQPPQQHLPAPAPLAAATTADAAIAAARAPGMGPLATAASLPPAGTGQLNTALKTLQATTHAGTVNNGLVQVNCAMLDSVLTSLLKAASDQDQTINTLQARLDALQEQVTGNAQKTEVDQRTLITEMSRVAGQPKAAPAPPLQDAALRQTLEGLQARLHIVELKCEEATTAAGLIPHMQMSIDAVKQDVAAQQGLVAGRMDMLAAEVTSLKALVGNLALAVHAQPPAHDLSTPLPGNPSSPLSPHLRSSINDVLVACQSLASKQADCVTVVAQSCNRIDVLDAAMASVQDVVSSLCYTLNELQKSVDNTQALFDLPTDLAPYLGTVEDRVDLLHTRPAFESILMRIAEVQHAMQLEQQPQIAPIEPPPSRPPPSNVVKPSSDVDLVGMGDRIRHMRNLAGEAGAPAGRTPIPELGINRGQLEAADRLVSSLAATLTGGRDKGGLSPVRSRSPRAREFHRMTSLSPGAPSNAVQSPARGHAVLARSPSDYTQTNGSAPAPTLISRALSDPSHPVVPASPMHQHASRVSQGQPTSHAGLVAQHATLLRGHT